MILWPPQHESFSWFLKHIILFIISYAGTPLFSWRPKNLRAVKVDVILKPNVDCKFAPPTAFVQNEMEQKIKRQTMLFQGGIPVFCSPSIGVAQSINYPQSTYNSILAEYRSLGINWNLMQIYFFLSRDIDIFEFLNFGRKGVDLIISSERTCR